MYYLLEDYKNCIQYFEESYSLKKERRDLFSLKMVVSKGSVSGIDESEGFEDQTYAHEISLQSLQNFEEIYDNRIYSK